MTDIVVIGEAESEHSLNGGDTYHTVTEGVAIECPMCMRLREIENES